MRGAVNDLSLGAGNVPFWLRDHGDDLRSPRLSLDRPWIAPDGISRTSLSLSDILSAVAAYRQMYQGLGIRPGNVVVIQFQSPIDVYLHWVALAADGAIAATVNPNLAFDVLLHYGRRVGAVGALVDAPLGEAGASGLWWHSFPSANESLSPIAVTAGPEAVADRPEYSHRPDEVVLLCHTSGTTDYPKPVTASHQGFMVGIRSELRQSANPLFGSTMLNALPAAHISFLSTITWALLNGTKLILASDQSAQTLIDDVERFEPDCITSFSSTLRDVAALGLAPGSLQSVGLWMTTGDASRSRDIQTVVALGTHPVAGARRAPGMFVLDCFGSSELGYMHFTVLHAPGQRHDARCIGRPTSFASAAIVDEEGNELPEGRIGYIAVRSDSVTPGYWNDPERTAASRRGSYWITGDVGYRDGLGRYFHLDRHSDVIETSHGPVYSVRSEEELLSSIPEVKRCAVVGRQDEDGDVQAVCLVETHHSESDESVLHRNVNAVLAAASLSPVAETIVCPAGTLPLGPTGKIRKYLVRSRLESSRLRPEEKSPSFH